MQPLFPSREKHLIGVVHLRPLPGSPRWSGAMKDVVRAALIDAAAYEKGGAHALVIENFGDLPFTRNAVPPATVAARAVVAREVREVVGLPFGFNVLRNDPGAALSLCAACGGAFIRVNVHSGAMLTDQGLIEGDAFRTLRLRRELGLDAQILADVHVKHAVPLGGQSIGDAARDTLDRGLADGLIVSGTGTGRGTQVADVEAVREDCPEAKLFIGSGVNASNVRDLLPLADGFIVGSALKRGGDNRQPVDARRVAKLAAAIG